MAHWVKTNEPSTLKYFMAMSDANPLQALIFEQYENKRAYTDVHKLSERFLAFKKEMMAMNDEQVVDSLGWSLTGQSYQLPIGVF